MNIAQVKVKYGSTVVVVLAFACTFGLLVRYAPLGVDWQHTFAKINWRNPWVDPSFTNPPWAVLLLPHLAIPLVWSNAVNLLLNMSLLGMLVIRLNGGLLGLLLLFTSPVFLDLARVNNLEWMIALGLLLPAPLGTVLLAVKPHLAMGATLIWARRHGMLVIFTPLVFVLLLSFLVWGYWLPRSAGLPDDAAAWNLSAWPVGIPVGLWLLWRAWQEDDEYLAAVATPLMMPYVAVYSVSVSLAVIAGRWPRAAAWLWFGLWWYFLVALRRQAF